MYRLGLISFVRILGLASLLACPFFIYVSVHQGHPTDALKNIKLQKPAVTVSPRNVDLTQTVFVTAADFSHFEESKASIASLQKNLPLTHRIFYYDLGLKEHQVKEVKTWCRVTYRMFQFDDYPPHFKILKSFGWKVLLVHNMLKDYNSVAYFDASMRFKCPNFMDQLEPTVRKGGVIMTDPTGHSIYAVTHPNMYKYLPTNISLLKKTEEFGSCFFIVVNSSRVIEKIMQPWVKCAMIEDCTYASRVLSCKFGHERFTRYAGCHRPQSALNILLAEEHKGDVSMYYAKGTCVHIQRKPSSMFKLQKCEK